MIKNRKDVTLKDIADKLGISQGTVSLALSNAPGVKKGTRKKVLIVAEELGYNMFSYFYRRQDDPYPPDRESENTDKNVTIYDIAKALHISAGTVSKALNNAGLVKESTKKEIVNMSRKLGYIKNGDAKSLRANNQQTGTAKVERTVTIYDIAKKLNISASTVSRCFGENTAIAPQTKQKILQAAQEMGFIYHNYARRLRNKRSHIIGVIAANISNVIITEIIAGIENVANEFGYDIIISNSFNNINDNNLVKKPLQMLYEHTDGLIVIPINSTPSKLFTNSSELNKPAVSLGSFNQNCNSSRITLDQLQATYELTEHLIRNGCRRICYIDNTSGHQDFLERLKAYQKAHEGYCLHTFADLVIHDDVATMSPDDVCHAILSMNPLPDGIIMSDQVFSASAVRELECAGINIVENLVYAEFEIGSLKNVDGHNITRLTYDYFELGKSGAYNLIQKLLKEAKRPTKNSYTLHQLSVSSGVIV